LSRVDRATKSPAKRIDAIRRLVVRLGTGEVGADGVWLAGALQQYLDHASDVLTLGAAAEVEPGAWWQAERRARRDDALREYADRFLPSGSIRARAADLRAALRRYEAVQWLSDRRAGKLPDGMEGTPRSYLFRACIAAVDGISAAQRSLKSIERALSHCSDCRTEKQEDPLSMSLGRRQVGVNSKRG
jgi:hypothetical protein